MDVSRKGIVVSVGFILAAVFLLYDSYTTKEVYLNEGALYPMTIRGYSSVSGLSFPACTCSRDALPWTYRPVQGAAYHPAHYGGVGRIYDPAASPRFPGCELPAALRRIPHPPLSLPDQAHTDRRRGILLPLVHLPKADRPPASLRDVALFLISAFPTPKRREDAQWLILFSPPFRCPLMPKRCSSCSSELFTEPSSARCRGSAPS